MIKWPYRIIESEPKGQALHYFKIDIFSHDQLPKGPFYVRKVLEHLSHGIGLQTHEDVVIWRAIPYKTAAVLLRKGFKYDLAYTSGEIDSKHNAEKYTENILSQFEPLETISLANTSDDLWSSSSSGWNAITDWTIDVGVLITDFKTIIITIFASED